MSDRVINRTLENKQIPIISLVVVTLLMIGSIIFAISRVKTEETRLNESWTDHAAASYASGSGSKSDPYIITSGEELALLSKQVNEGLDTSNTYYKVNNTISLKNYEWLPIGYENSFKGVFNGNCKRIKELRIVGKKNVSNYGLFGKNEGIVYDTYLFDSNVNLSFTESKRKWMSGENLCVGTLVGINSGEILGCKSKSKLLVTDSDKLIIGMLAGKNSNGTISSSSSTGDIQIEDTEIKSVGGLVGKLTDNSANLYSYSTGNINILNPVNKDYLVGGFAGDSQDSFVNQCVSDMKYSDNVAQTDYDKAGAFFGQVRKTSCESNFAMMVRNIKKKNYYLPFATDSALDSNRCGYISKKNTATLIDSDEVVKIENPDSRITFYEETIGLSKGIGRWGLSRKVLMPKPASLGVSYVPDVADKEVAVSLGSDDKFILCRYGYVDYFYEGKIEIDGVKYRFHKGKGKIK